MLKFARDTFKGKFLISAMLMTIILISSPTLSSASPISGVTVETVSSEYVANGWDLAAVHTIDGSGLSGNPATHSMISYPAGQSWQTISQTGTGQIVFDLGASYALTSMHIWNLNFYAPYNGRGACVVAISTSSDMGSWDTKGNYGFSMASGLDGDPGFDILISEAWNSARYIKFDILSNFGGGDNAGHVGLSEVQFFADSNPVSNVPEPATMILLGLGIIGMSGVRGFRR